MMKSSLISECVRTAFDRDRSLNNLLSTMLLGTQFDAKKNVKIVVLKEEGASSNGATGKKKKRLSHLNMELNRIEEGKLFEWVIKCQVQSAINVERFNVRLPYTAGIRKPNLRKPETFENQTFWRSVFEWF